MQWAGHVTQHSITLACHRLPHHDFALSFYHFRFHTSSQARSQNCKKATISFVMSARSFVLSFVRSLVRSFVRSFVRSSVRPSVCLSALVEQLGTHWTNYDEILYLRLSRKSVQKTKLSLEFDTNNGYFTWRFITCMTFRRWIFLRMRNVSNKSCTDNETPHFMFGNFFPKIVPFMR
jgi:hypothetical protein